MTQINRGCGPKVLKLSSNGSDVFPKVLEVSFEVSECKPLARGSVRSQPAAPKPSLHRPQVPLLVREGYYMVRVHACCRPFRPRAPAVPTLAFTPRSRAPKIVRGWAAGGPIFKILVRYRNLSPYV